MAVQIQLRRDTAADWTSTNPTLAAGEMGFETDTRKYKLGDGETAWSGLAYGVLDGFTSGRRYAFDDTTTDADPGAGNVRFNHATFASITEIYFDDADYPGGDATAWLDALDDSSNANKGTLLLQKQGDPDIYREFTVTGSVTDGTGYRKVPVSPLTEHGTLADADLIVVAFFRAGNAGTIETTGTKTDLVDDDEIVLKDSEDSNAPKVTPWSNLKAKLADSGILAGFRNKIINGGFDVWQRGTSQSYIGYGSDDRWYNSNVGSTKTHSRQAFALGQTDVPGNPTYFSRTVVSSVAGAANFVLKLQRIENVRTLSGGTATLTFWAKADASKNIAVEMAQAFGTGGSPSTIVSIPCGLKALTANWQKISFTVDIPSLSGKTLGSNEDDSLQLLFWFEAGSNFATRTSGIGQQSGTFDLAEISLVPGDATAEDNPTPPRDPQQELARCQRFGLRVTSHAIDAKDAAIPDGRAPITFPVTMRAAPTLESGSFTMLSGNDGTPGLSFPSATGTGLYNTANNWTANVGGSFTGFLGAEI